jgi:spermidine/putrescine transport system ATP-binding protein
VTGVAGPDESPGTEAVTDASPSVRQLVVELLGVTKVYPEGVVPAVDGIELAIEEGEFFSILGPSGCGKTTTLRVIAGFERPTAGVVRLAGRDVTRQPPYRRNVNTVFQNYALFPHMRVRENVAYPLRMAKVDREETRRRVAEVLEQVEMTGFEDRRPHQLSGGQRQRVALARALVGQPQVLLLDEPLGALDLKLRESMLVVLKHLQRQVGITFVYVTHDQGEALAMSDRLAVMHHGRIEQVASPGVVYRRPATSFVASFIGKTNLLSCEATNGVVRSERLPIRLGGAAPPGKFVLSVRPEDVRIGELEDIGPANSYSGVVTDVLFLGHEREILVDVEGQSFIVRATGGLPIAPGDRVQVGWPVEAGVVVEQSD